jgi:hypothetical protein
MVLYPSVVVMVVMLGKGRRAGREQECAAEGGGYEETEFHGGLLQAKSSWVGFGHDSWRDRGEFRAFWFTDERSSRIVPANRRTAWRWGAS